MRRAIILANVGTPDEPRIRAVYRYLTQFLNDGRVIDLPLLARLLLVNGIIIPFRVRNSTKLYKQLWTPKGSPLLYLTENLRQKLAKKLGDDFGVYIAMRYGKPSIDEILNTIRKEQFDEVIVLPMFPQYASSTTGTASGKVLSEISRWNVIPGIRFIGQFYQHPAYIDAFAAHAAQYMQQDWDHFIFSFHGLPDSHVNVIHPSTHVNDCKCATSMPDHGQYCYKATSYATTRLIAKKLNISPEQYTVAFQSRLTKNWLRPFSDEVVKDLAKQGKKKVLVFAPSFVTDCLETIIEIGHEYKELFIENGGQVLQLAEGLNDSDLWAEALHQIIEESL